VQDFFPFTDNEANLSWGLRRVGIVFLVKPSGRKPLDEGMCVPGCGCPLERLKEESYFLLFLVFRTTFNFWKVIPILFA
jgi:hypothetical protein